MTADNLLPRFEFEFEFDDEAHEQTQMALDFISHAQKLHLRADEGFKRSRYDTDRRLDEASRVGRRIYIAAGGLLATAHDHHIGLRSMFKSGHVGPSAPWTMLRAVFESSLWALWIVDSPDPEVRMRRAIRREVADLSQRVKWRESLKGVKRSLLRDIRKRDAEIETIYREDATDVGLDYDKIRDNGPDLVSELKTLRAIPGISKQDSHLVESTWRSLSGVAHGFMWAQQASTVLHRDEERPGGRSQVRTIDEQLFGDRLLLTSSIAVRAADLYFRRSTTISNS